MPRMRLNVLFFTILLLLVLTNLTFAQSTYTEAPTTPAPLLSGPPFPDDWVQIPMLNQNELTLKTNKPPATITATIPTGFESATVTWASTDTNVISVETNSPARVSPVGAGTANVIVNLAHEGVTYYDYCIVTVLSDDTLATPGTSGSLTLYIFASLLLVVALPPLYRSRFEQ